ncbi:energy-coupling factor ABC transporter permease [Geomonas subterranea]|uniref:Energy-coupling factor ABC transporter permease n=1 Tax=Geomonas subterranea TaxID=2847989 RepID=A0ABX8LJP9_9BACT|nr:energy-coupling factor ABC transporter permease [Geomonas subterranea]QXE91922.1 energy-coupling factor ABC transporter permease [Geomonas subterranea]QXM09986.1 energy-coupling factor ABC transporter permease [Geomonas subterranea]
MHMADALLSPAVGTAMWAVSAGSVALASRRLCRKRDDRLAPLMGVLGGFLFAAQMINFSIPGTGSSGHLTGGLLLAILLGPSAAFLTVASVLVIQAFLFADGGLLALGCNIFNLGIIPALLVYPLCYQRLIGQSPGRRRESVVTMVSAVIAMQLGALCVVLETAASGISVLPLDKFLFLMQPIHFAIGLVEGAVTLAVVSFLRKARPELLARSTPGVASGRIAFAALLVVSLLVAGALSRFASEKPDGLEWSVEQVTGDGSLPGHRSGLSALLGALQKRTAWLAEYRIAPAAIHAEAPAPAPAASQSAAATGKGSGLPGVIGTLLTVLLVAGATLLLRRGNRGSDTPGA